LKFFCAGEFFLKKFSHAKSLSVALQ